MALASTRLTNNRQYPNSTNSTTSCLQTRYTLSFGQGVAVTAMQMAEVYATIANGGVRVQPTLIAGTTSPAGKHTAAPAPQSRRVIQATTARELLQILQQVPAVDAAGAQ